VQVLRIRRLAGRTKILGKCGSRHETQAYCCERAKGALQVARTHCASPLRPVTCNLQSFRRLNAKTSSESVSTICQSPRRDAVAKARCIIDRPRLPSDETVFVGLRQPPFPR
jgi:hypothetical protein